MENTNGRLRRHLPGNVLAERLTAENLDALAARLNATPPRCPGYQTPAEVFNSQPKPAQVDGGLSAAVSH